MTKRRNPCYNCDEREVTCRCECTAWLEYVKKRDAEYTRAERRRNMSGMSLTGWNVVGNASEERTGVCNSSRSV